MIKTGSKPTESSRSRSLKGSLLANISHDLKSFLNPIIGFSSVLLQDDQRLKADQIKHIKVIYDSAKKLLERIDAMFLLLRLQQQDQSRAGERLELAHLLREQIELLRESGAAKDIRLEMEGDQPIRLQSDSQLLACGVREVLEYCLERLSCGEIKILLRQEQASPAPQAIVEISCPGVRVSAKEAENWRLFLQAGDVLPSDIKGIGLWLALARASIISVGGQLNFHPQKGWEIRLPL